MRIPALWPIYLTIFLDLLGLGLVIPIFAPLFLNVQSTLLPEATPLQGRTILLGVLIAAYPLSQFFGAPVLGGLSDRFGRRRVLIFSLMGTVLGYMVFVLGLTWEVIPLLFAGRIIDGFTGGNISTALSAIADCCKGNSKTKAYGIAGGAVGAGLILGPFIGGKLADPTIVSWFSHATPFWFAAMLSALNTLAVTFFFRETLRRPRYTRIRWTMGIRYLYRAMQLKDLRTVFIVIFLLNFGFNFFAQFFQVYLIQQFQMTESQVGNLFGYAGLWIVLAQGLITRPLAHYFQHQTLVAISSFGLATSLLVLLVPDQAIWLYAVLPAVALFQGVVQPNSLSLISDLGHDDSQGEIMGINQSIQSLAQAVPPLIAGVIASFHPILPIVGGSIAVSLAGLVFLWAFMPSRLPALQSSAG